MHRIAFALSLALPLSCGAEEAKPAVEVVGLEGIDAALAKHRGRGVLLNFWALWCAPCKAEMPELMEVAAESAPRGGSVVLVSYDLIVPGANLEQARREVTAYAEQHGLNVPILIYDAPDYEAINQRFKLPGGVPVTLAFDAEGKQVDVQDGPADKARFQAMMQRALGG